MHKFYKKREFKKIFLWALSILAITATGFSAPKQNLVQVEGVWEATYQRGVYVLELKDKEPLVLIYSDGEDGLLIFEGQKIHLEQGKFKSNTLPSNVNIKIPGKISGSFQSKLGGMIEVEFYNGVRFLKLDFFRPGLIQQLVKSSDEAFKTLENVKSKNKK